MHSSYPGQAFPSVARAAKAPHGGTGVELIGISKFSEGRKASRLLRMEKRE